MTLTISDHIALDIIVRAAQTSASVRWLDDDKELRDGVARHLVADAVTAAFIGSNDDIRDAYLRITSWGLEYFIPVRKLMVMVTEGEFAID